MKISPDVIQSINEGGVDLSSTWAWFDSFVYSANYIEVYNQPMSLEATTLDYLRFKDDVTTITIRKSNDPNSEIVWSGVSYNISDSGNGIDGDEGAVTEEQQQISTGVVGSSAPSAIYGTGTITIAEANVNLYSNSTFSGIIKTYYIPGATFTLTDNTEQYLVADYNNGTPIYRIENNKLNINKSNIALIRICWRQGDTVHSIDSDCQGTALANKIESALINTTPYKKSIDGGLALGETSTPTARTVTVSSAVVFAASTPHDIGAFNSSTNKFTFVRHVAGVWTYSDVAVYNNTQYDNGSDLVALGNNKYGVCWIYRSIGNDVQCFFVLGNTDYNTIASAQTSKVRTDIPLLLRDHCMLVGRIIVQLNASSGLVENVSDTTFSSGSITNHNDLSNIQGVGPEYYHLSNTQYTDLTDAGDSALHYHATDRNRADHTGTQLAATISDFSATVRSTALTGYVVGANTAISATDTVLSAFQKVQGQLNGKQATIAAGTSAQYRRGDNTWQTLNTAAVPELTNLYWTQARFDTAFGAKSTTNLAEGTNLYYTQARFDSAFGLKNTDALAEGTTNLYFTNARADARITLQKGVALGLTPLDSGAKISTTYLPDAILGAMRYQTVWDASTNTPPLPAASASNKGYYWIVSVAYGVYNVGDWVVSNGASYDKIDNTDSISSWNTRTGAIVPLKGDYSTWFVDLAGSYSNPTWITALDPAKITQTASYRFVTDTEKATWNAKQGAITTGTTLQYFRGDLSLATFPTTWSATALTGLIPDANIASASVWNAKQNAITTGTAAQYINGTLGLTTFPTTWAGTALTGLVPDANIASASTWNSKQAGSTILTSIAAQSAGTGFLRLTAGVASLDTNSYALAVAGGYLPLSGGTLTGSLYGAVGFANTFNKDITPTTASNINYAIAPLVVQRQTNSSTTTTLAAGIGFHNPGANGAFLYYDHATSVFMYNRNIAGSLVTIWDSSNLSFGTGATNMATGNHLHTGVYLPLAGGSMSGSLTFANGMWNTVGDDSAIGDINEGATLGLTGRTGGAGSYLRFCAYNQTNGNGAGTGVRIGYDGTKFAIEGNTNVTGALTRAGNTVYDTGNLLQANTSTNGWLSSTDWNKFNNKLDRIPTNIANGDANTLTNNGVYGGYSIANAPESTWLIIRVYRMPGDGGDQIWQLAYSSYGSNTQFQRYSADYGVTWSGWSRHATEAMLGGYLPLAGGSMNASSQIDGTSLSIYSSNGAVNNIFQYNQLSVGDGVTRSTISNTSIMFANTTSTYFSADISSNIANSGVYSSIGYMYLRSNGTIQSNDGTTTCTTSSTQLSYLNGLTGNIQTQINGKLSTTGKAADSELLDGIDSTRFVFGDNGTASRNITDFNAVVKSGFGSGASATGSPTTGWYHIITNKHHGDTTGWLFQIAAGFGMSAGPATPEGYFVRIKEGTSAPGAWRTLWHSGNLASTTVGRLTTSTHSYGINRLYRADGDASQYWVEARWESNFSGHNTWRLRGQNSQNPVDGQTGINTVGVDYADYANILKGVSRAGDGGQTIFATSTGSKSAISNGVNSALINRYDYSGWMGFIGSGNTEFWGICQDHNLTGGGSELSLIAGASTGHISFFAGTPTLQAASGCYQAPLVGDWTNAGLSITGTLSVSGAITGSNLNISNWNTAYSHAQITSGNPHGTTWAGILSKSTTIANFVDGAWAGADGYYGWSSSTTTRFGFSASGGGVVNVYTDGNFYATDNSYLVWHSGNLVGNQTGHTHSQYLETTTASSTYQTIASMANYATLAGNNTWTGTNNFGNAHIGTWASDNTYARFGHKDFNNSSYFGFLQKSSGAVLLKGGGYVDISVDSADRIILAFDGTTPTNTLYGKTIVANGDLYCSYPNIAHFDLLQIDKLMVRSVGDSYSYLDASGTTYATAIPITKTYTICFTGQTTAWYQLPDASLNTNQVFYINRTSDSYAAILCSYSGSLKARNQTTYAANVGLQITGPQVWTSTGTIWIQIH